MKIQDEINVLRENGIQSYSKFINSKLSLGDLCYRIDWEGYSEKTKRELETFLRPGFYWIYGGVGTGKTCMAKIIAKEFLKSDKSVYFTTSPQLNNNLFKFLSERQLERYIDFLAKVDVLILDDVEKINLSNNFVGSLLFGVIDQRYVMRERQTTLATSNISPTFTVSNMNYFFKPILDRFKDGRQLFVGNISYRGRGN